MSESADSPESRTLRANFKDHPGYNAETDTISWYKLNILERYALISVRCMGRELWPGRTDQLIKEVVDPQTEEPRPQYPLHFQALVRALLQPEASRKFTVEMNDQLEFKVNAKRPGHGISYTTRSTDLEDAILMACLRAFTRVPPGKGPFVIFESED